MASHYEMFPAVVTRVEQLTPLRSNVKMGRTFLDLVGEAILLSK